MSNNPPGWFPDPFGRAQVRWWSGSGWTDHVATSGQEFLDPPGAGQHAVSPTGPAPAATAQAAAPVPVVAPVAAAPPGKVPPAMQKLAIVGVAALLVGGLAGWLLRGDGGGGKGGGGGGAAVEGTLSSPILAGLASLNSYEWKLSAVTVGPTDADRSEETGNGASDSGANLRYVKQVSTSTSADDPEPSTSTTETWTTADSTCTFDGEEYTVDPANPFMADVGTVLAGVFDIVVPSGNSTLVGEEQVAGVNAKHYSFTIEGLGGGTGAQVDQNQGNVWVAADGNYLLKYQVVASMRATASDGTVELYTIDLTLELTSVNQPVTITVPSGCAAAGGTVSG